MKYTEEREFNVHLVLRCEFPEDYEGELDGYVWAEDVPRITGEVVSAVVAALSRRPEWKLRGGNRGRPTEDEVTLVLERVLAQVKAGRDG
jgi:hypothetical protein